MMLFWRKGYEGTSLSDLTTKMGIRPASLYAAFGSKESLFLEALSRYRSGVGSGLPRIMREARTSRDAVRQLLEGTATAITRRSQPQGCMVVLSSLRGFVHSSKLDREMQRCRAEDQSAIAARLRQGVIDGELPAQCAPDAMAAFIMSVLQGMSVQARDGASKSVLMEIAGQAMAVWPVPSQSRA